MSETPVIDVHAHYLPPAAFPQMGVGRAVVSVGSWCDVDGHVRLNGMPVGATTDMLTSVEGILAAMSGTGVDVRVLSPPPFSYRYWSDPADGLALHRMINDATAAVVAEHPAHFRGLCTVPLQDPALALQELERAHEELGLVGVTLGTNVDGRNLTDPELRPFLRAVAERGCPVLVHPDFVPVPRLSEHYLINLIGLPTETATTLGNLILSGALEELPDLRICFVHGGGSLPYLLGRLDKGWRVRPESRALTSRPPTEQLGNVYFDTLTHSPQALRYLIDVVGADHVVVGTDAPFDVEDTAPLEHLASCPGLTDSERSTILGRSAERWLGTTAAAVRE